VRLPAWREIENGIGRHLLLLTSQVVRWVPTPFLPSLGAAVGPSLSFISPRHRKLVMRQLRQALGDQRSETELELIARRFYRNICMNLLEFLKMPFMSDQELSRRVTLHGRHNLDNALAQHKGVILLTAHYGNWELVGAALVLAGYQVNVIAREQHHLATNELLTGLRQHRGMKVIYTSKGLREVLRCLHRNELVCILGDVNAGNNGVFVDFFGKLASTAPGPAAFALRTGAAVVPAFTHRNPDHTHTCEVMPPVQLPRTGDHDADVVTGTALLTKIVEEQVRRRPEQWYWLANRWKARPPWEQAAGLTQPRRATAEKAAL